MARPRLHDAALRTRLLEVASHAVAAGGEGAVTVRSVAAAAGTSASAVYALFGSRDELVAAVSAEGFRRFAGHLAAVPRTEDPLADLRELGLAYRTSALADPHFYRVMFERAVPPAADAPPAVERPTFRVLRDAVARLLAGAPDDRVEAAAVALWGLVHGLVSLELADLLPGDDDERAARYAAALAAVGPALLAG
ncbi:TetR/AcrR family transcriptional regulator [Isoptericola variabilis]|uniref:Regulatory protein TetR n=1 Tax=Isoptericola variabilis (strain 225) TaxID=743718 RepID=F6FSD7_ISOV2|nr:TetR-like C-terminal domain-containing protein [Isoptericola variabilis]AEG44004.1 regulatory protein TetR [Isoptericola variabilis 225]TWH30597.1 TetR family transcriptional regulator [Isoptericola variabilis J7]